MPNGVTDPPPPPATAGIKPNGVAGDMYNGATQTTITESILSLLQSVLSAF